MKNKTLVTVSIILGIVFVIVAFIYWFTPAGSLPAFMPGYMAGAATVHVKHAILSLILGILLFVLAWFKSGKRPSGTTTAQPSS